MINLKFGKDKLKKSHSSPALDEYGNSRKGFIVEVVSGTIITNLTGGIFLSGFLEYLGFSQSLNGIISGFPVYTTALQPLGAFLAAKFGNLKRSALAGSLIQRIAYSLLYFLPLFIFRDNLAFAVPLTFLISTAMSAVIAPSTTDWMMQITPPKMRKDFFTIREIALVGANAIVSLIVGIIIDNYRRAGVEGKGYTALGIVIIIFSVIYVGSLIYIKAPPKMKHGNENIPKIKAILKEKPFLLVIIVSIIYNFGIQIASPFWNIHALRNLNRSYVYMTILALITSAAKVLVLQFWRRFNGGEAWGKMCAFCMASIGLNHLLNAFAFPQNAGWLLYIPAIAGVPGYAIIGFALLNFQYNNISHEQKFVHISIIAVANGLASFAATMLGGGIVNIVGKANLTLGESLITGQQFLMVISAAILFVGSFFVIKIVKVKQVE